MKIETLLDFNFVSRSNFKLDFLLLWLLPEKKRVENWKLLCLKPESKLSLSLILMMIIDFWKNVTEGDIIITCTDFLTMNVFAHRGVVVAHTSLLSTFRVPTTIRNMQFTTPYYLLIIKGKKHINWWLSNFHCNNVTGVKWRKNMVSLLPLMPVIKKFCSPIPTITHLY